MLLWHLQQSPAHCINVDDLSISDKIDSQRNQINRTRVMGLIGIVIFCLVYARASKKLSISYELKEGKVAQAKYGL